MKPCLLKIDGLPSATYSIRHDILPSLAGLWHFHPELELHYVIKGEGVKFIGDNISDFSPGEVVLLGQNIPHCWRCNNEYHQPESKLNVEVIVIRFMPTCFGSYLLNLPEAYLLPRLFERAKNGMVIKGPAKADLIKLMHAALNADNFERIIILLKILKILAENEDYISIISSPKTFFLSTENENIRLSKVFAYTLNHFRDELDLGLIAEISNLSSTSFCRYFKQMTGRRYSDFLTEIRIRHACRLLIEDSLPTTMICFDSGFNNISNFYRHFNKVIGMTPQAYKIKYLQSPILGRR